jgi:hypothetical protein
VNSVNKLEDFFKKGKDSNFENVTTKDWLEIIALAISKIPPCRKKYYRATFVFLFHLLKK